VKFSGAEYHALDGMDGYLREVSQGDGSVAVTVIRPDGTEDPLGSITPLDDLQKMLLGLILPGDA